MLLKQMKSSIPAVPNSMRLHSMFFNLATSFAFTSASTSVRVVSF